MTFDQFGFDVSGALGISQRQTRSQGRAQAMWFKPRTDRAGIRAGCGDRFGIGRQRVRADFG
jgi:hypothetical protein